MLLSSSSLAWELISNGYLLLGYMHEVASWGGLGLVCMNSALRAPKKSVKYLVMTMTL